MGDIIGGIIGGVGSLIGGNDQEKADKAAAKQALTGFNYATTGAGAPLATQFENSGLNALTAQQGTQGTIAGLLGVGGDPAAAQTGFKNYLNSTGYNFMLNQGQNAITGSAAAKGILNSGATGKALTQYGQNLGTQYFNNYLGQLGGLNSAQQATANAGQNMLQTVIGAGTTGGANAGNATMAAGNAQSTGLNNALGQFSNSLSNAFGFLG